MNAQTAPILHQPFWCEENIWHLAQHPAVAGLDRWVLVLTGAEEEVACWQQKAAKPGEPVFWDYHVVLVTHGAHWLIWDLDTRAGYPIPASVWLHATFPCPEQVHGAFQPRFALLPATEYIEQFGSDRAHMRLESGDWQQPLPPWPAINGRGLTLGEAIETSRRGLDQKALEAFFQDE